MAAREAARSFAASAFCSPAGRTQAALAGVRAVTVKAELRALRTAVTIVLEDVQPADVPDVRSVQVRAAGPDTFDFDVTVSSPYDSPARYADGIRARSPGGAVYGRRKLFHDHADEQPFTRDMHGVRVPAGVRSVVVEARDLKHGYGGKTVVVDLPGR